MVSIVEFYSTSIYLYSKEETPLQWMYKENKADSEDFLLGKRIDTLDNEAEAKTEGKLIYIRKI